MSGMYETDPARDLEAARDHIGKLTLGDIYGRVRQDPKRVPITFEQYKYFDSSEGEGSKREFAKLHGITNIGSWGGGFLYEAISTDELAKWVPYANEREVILQVAQAVAGNNRRPSLVEVGCGTGLLSHVLGLDQQVSVLGIDISQEALGKGKFPPIPHTGLVQADVWDFIHQIGPRYPAEVAHARTDLLTAIKSGNSSFTQSDFLGILIGDEKSLVGEIADLQSLAPLFEEPSPVDLVVCSFMHEGADLTVPIRDGIFPKAIVYIRPTNGKSGAGDYYYADKYSAIDLHKWNAASEYDWDESIKVVIGPNTHISYNPGIHYKSVACWATPWNSDHDVREQKFRRTSAEVVIQVRKDVAMRPTTLPSLQTHTFDQDIENAFESSNGFDTFQTGIEEARVGLKISLSGARSRDALRSSG